jgi:hypothetical protein
MALIAPQRRQALPRPTALRRNLPGSGVEELFGAFQRALREDHGLADIIEVMKGAARHGVGPQDRYDLAQLFAHCIA